MHRNSKPRCPKQLVGPPRRAERAPTFDDLPPVVLPLLPAAELDARIPVQQEFAVKPISRRGGARPTVEDACR